LTVSN